LRQLLNQKSEIKNQKSELHVSALPGFGIPELLELIKNKIHEHLDGAEAELVVNERTRELLAATRDELKQALTMTNYDLFAEHVRAAGDSVGRILGVIGADEVMDATFGRLCLGK